MLYTSDGNYAKINKTLLYIMFYQIQVTKLSELTFVFNFLIN